ncbi:MAG: hypothetical protein IT373_10735 [Polyangiaceae bacterium]|nr:hypothetical protein [Polyangiaceae bacterium]
MFLRSRHPARRWPGRRARTTAVAWGALVALVAFGAGLAACAADRPRNRIEAPDDPAWWQALEAARPDAGTPLGADAGRDGAGPD